jgi:hypothetical protein
LKTSESSVGGRNVRWVNININDADPVPTPIEDIKAGMTLVVEKDGGARLFQVDRVKLWWNDGGTTHTLTSSQPILGRDPWVISGPPGTMLTRLVRKQQRNEVSGRQWESLTAPAWRAGPVPIP